MPGPDASRIYDAFETGFDSGQRGKQRKEDLAFKMARAKSEDKYHQDQIENQSDQERLRYGEQGLDLDTIKAGQSERASADMADQALGPGTADEAGIGRMGLAGAGEGQMSGFLSRMSRKQNAGVRDAEAQADQRAATAEWMRRRNSGGAGGGKEQLAAAKIALQPLNAKMKLGDQLTEAEQETYNNAMQIVGASGGFDYTPPSDADRAPKPKKPGLMDKIAGIFKGGAAPAAPKDSSARYLELRAKGVPPDQARQQAMGGK